ncbi:MAG: family 10 glycosylhydrolase, partial [Cyanothece sp. SIO1E1]|nr:family 10 glycosylhydrolase [Cyanothece sp. SIO1E1]
GDAGFESVPKWVPHPTLVQAQQFLEDWPSLLQAQEYEIARERWLEIQQALWENFPTDRPLAQPEVRSIWLDRGTIVKARYGKKLARLFDRLAAAGINTVFMETVNAGYPIYPSQVAPEQNPLTRGWDPLAEAIELAHERGIELHAWVWVFAAGNQLHNRLLNLPTDYVGPILAANPDWANYDNRGEMIPPGQTKPFLDPANPAVRGYLLRLLGEIANNYAIDGVQLDYIRYPFQDPAANRTYGYGLAARQQFEQMTGVDPINLSPRESPEAPLEERLRQRHLWQQWTSFRIEQVNSFVAEAGRFLRRQRPNLVISAAVFAHPEHERWQKIQQNWEVWAKRGDIDFLMLMSYALDTNRLEQLTYPWLTSAALNNALILPGIRLLNLPNEAAVDQIQTLRDLPAGGYGLFAVENLNENLQTILNRTQGARRHNASEPVPYRNPFQTALARYDALRREWSFLLANELFWMSSSEFGAWKDQVEALGKALDALATDPSNRHLTQVKSHLNQVQAGLAAPIDVASVNSSYRIQVWKHRLVTLATLLNYGERVVLQRPAPVSAR